MDKIVFADKYEAVDTLFSNELQTIYTAKTVGVDEAPQFLVNEFRDTDIIYSMKDNFSPDKCRYIRNIVDTFYKDFNFYVVSTICSGPTLETFLSDNSLRLTEKMYITDSLLNRLIEMERLSPFIIYALCDTSNLAVNNRKTICFNCNIKLSKEDMAVSGREVSVRIGEIICAIFENTVHINIESARHNMPPALYPIVKKCLDGGYASASDIYNDFKSLLLYSVFIENSSVDTQMRRNYKKAESKRRLRPVKRLAVLVIIAVVLWSSWTLVHDYRSRTAHSPTSKNAKPVASFEASRDQIYVGDSVVFTSKSEDPDADDRIKSHFWVISKDGQPIFNSSNQNIAYKFEEPGSYGVHLVVADSHDESSEPYKMYITVLPKPQPGTGDGIPKASDRK